MTVLLDHLSATLIGGVVLLIVLATLHLVQVEAMETTMHYSLARSTASYGDVLTRELRSLSRVISLRENPSDSTFTFLARVSAGDTTQSEVNYRRVLAGHRGGRPVYRIERYVNGALEGGSPVLVTDWNIEALRFSGQPASNTAEAVQIGVAFEAVAPFETEEHIAEELERTQWSLAVFPPFLRPDGR